MKLEKHACSFDAVFLIITIPVLRKITPQKSPTRKHY